MIANTANCPAIAYKLLKNNDFSCSMRLLKSRNLPNLKDSFSFFACPVGKIIVQ